MRHTWEGWHELYPRRRRPVEEPVAEVYERLANTIRALACAAAVKELMNNLELPPMEIGVLTAQARTGTGAL